MKKSMLLRCRLFAVIASCCFFQKLTAQVVNDVWPVTDTAWKKTLNGEWLLHVVKGVDSQRGKIPEADDTWRTIPVPGCWDVNGFCKPRYHYPDSLTGYYHTTFTIPETWKGKQVYIRLDGVLRGYDLWLNDHYVGTWESAYNTAVFHLTPYLNKKGDQHLSMRVYSHFKGSPFDCFDDWAPMGIFRDVTLMAVPKTHLSDLTVTTRTDGTVEVRPLVANRTKHTTVSYEVLDARGNVVSTDGHVDRLHLWTAETPYLYTLRVYVREKKKTLQTFEHRIGFREITIEGNLLKVNGVPVKLRGVNAHSTDPRTVKVIGDTLTLKDMRMMKEASVNFIRLSHYPREPRFYELADSMGFYLVDEIPFGYGDKLLSDTSYQDILTTRAEATIRRDKLHPSVIIWSVGNENPLPPTCVELGKHVAALDPSRPYCFPQVGSFFRNNWKKIAAPVYAPHYPTTEQLSGFYQHLDKPVVFTEYCHTLGISFEDHDRQWEIVEHTPGIAGGGVWEWADQGIYFMGNGARRRIEKRFGYVDKVLTPLQGGYDMHHVYGADGLVYADRTPLPGYYELQHNYARAFVTLDGYDSTEVRLSLNNRYDFLNLKENVTFRWSLTNNRDTVARGSFTTDCPPRSVVPYILSLPVQQGLSLLHVDMTDAQDYTFLRQSFVIHQPVMTWTGTGDPMQCVQETTVRAGRKATMAEGLTQKNRLPKKYLLPLENSQVKTAVRTTETEGGRQVTFSLLPDTADVFRAELGLAYLLDANIDRVQWLGRGPFASYPGRRQACRYGLWAKHMDDLYFEGNHEGVDAALLTDADGNGLLVVGDSLNLNFEQTDRGIVLTVNAAVSGQGPKFARTHFPGWTKEQGPVGASFSLYRIVADRWPQALEQLFLPASQVPAPLHPYASQYDTYLMKYDDVRLE